MDLQLGIAGAICVAMAFGHTAIGRVWVLPALTEDRLPKTPFGPPSLTLAMVRVTWFVVTIFVSALGGLLLALAWDGDADARTLLLRWFAAMWIAATALVFFVSPRSLLRNPRKLLRLPVPVLWIVVAVLCWSAST
ncbi:MAG: hypothetical protein M3279_06855 [Actinomycetota bacterium]|nr:hypothetical protein [Actinomycetota bacterium]